MFYALFKDTQEVLSDYNFKRLYDAVVLWGIDAIQTRGRIGSHDIVRIYDDTTETEVCSLHFGQTIKERGTDYSTVRVRAYRGLNNKDKHHFYPVRRYKVFTDYE